MSVSPNLQVALEYFNAEVPSRHSTSSSLTSHLSCHHASDCSPLVHLVAPTSHLSPLTSHLSPPTPHPSPLTSHLSPLTSHVTVTSDILPLVDRVTPHPSCH